MYRSIIIEPQESASALAEAAAQALGSALGWMVSGSNVWQKEDGLRIRFYEPTSGNIAIAVGNQYVLANNGAMAFNSAKNYCIDYIKTEHTVAVGIRQENGAICMPTIIAENALGEFKALMCTISSAAFCYYIDENSTTAKQNNMTITTTAGVSTALVRCPDIWGGCLFADLYQLVSCPFSGTDKAFVIGGKTYRFASGSPTVGFALLAD